MIQRIVEPGIPSWPPLFVDSTSGDCFVSTRIHDWRSVEQANAVSRLLLGGTYLLLAWGIWRMVPPYADDFRRMLVFAGVFAPLAIIPFPLLRSALPVVLSKTLFARRLNLIFTRDAVGLQCHFYRRSLKLQRLIADRRVSVQFLLTEDDEAKAFPQPPPEVSGGGWNKSRRHLHEARIVEMVIRSNNEPMTGQLANTAGRFRSIPIARVEMKRGEWLVVVLNAAFDMTKHRRTPPRPSGRGQDLDQPAIEET